MQYVARQYVRVISVFYGFYAPYLLSAHLFDLPDGTQDGDRFFAELLQFQESVYRVWFWLGIGLPHWWSVFIYTVLQVSPILPLFSS